MPKKDLEEPVVETEKPPIWGGSIVEERLTLIPPDMPAETKLPITVNAKKLGRRR